MLCDHWRCEVISEAKEPKLALRPREAAKALSVSESTLYRLRMAGKMPSIKVGAAILYRMADLESFLTSQEVVTV